MTLNAIVCRENTVGIALYAPEADLYKISKSSMYFPQLNRWKRNEWIIKESQSALLNLEVKMFGFSVDEMTWVWSSTKEGMEVFLQTKTFAILFVSNWILSI